MNTITRATVLYSKKSAFIALMLLGFVLTVSAQTTTVTLQFTPDCWGAETSWSFDQDGGSTLASASTGTYSDNFPNGSTTFTTEVTITIGQCYTLTINDIFGDGIFGSQWTDCNVNGSFNFLDENGDIFKSLTNLNFGTSTTLSFCAVYGCNHPSATNYNPAATLDDGSCVFPVIDVSFTSEIIEDGCGYRLVQFTNTSSVTGSSNWNFGNGEPSTSTAENPLVRFTTGTSQNVDLTISVNGDTETHSVPYDVPLNDESEPFYFVFDPDCYGSELSWNLRNASNDIIYSAAPGSYSDFFPTNPSTTYEVCLPAGCYTIEVIDTYGDGFDGVSYNGCNENGTYSVRDKFGNTIYQYGGTINFGYSVSNSSCISEYVWTGAFSTIWTNTGNWAGNVAPNSTSANVRIQSTNYDPTLTSNINVKNIIIEDNSALNFGNSNGRLSVYGNLTNKGTIDATVGRVDFRSSADQHIKASTEATTNFYELRLNKTNSVHLQSPISVKGLITLTSGFLELDGHKLTLMSNALYTGMITQTKTTSDIIGETVEMQRYFPAASGSWRMLCSPVTNATFEQWNDDMPTTGFPGSDYPNYPNAANPWSNIRKYNEGIAGGMNEGFESISGVTEAIDPKKGYFTYFAPSPTLLEVEGDFPRGDINYSLTYNSNGTSSSDIGWNMIANPYPCTVNWTNASGWTKTRLSNTIYAFDPISGQYSTYTNGVSVGNLTNLIGPFQAFWVKATSADPALTIRESAKSTSQGVFMRDEDADLHSLMRIKLFTNLENVYDETVIGFHALAAMGYDEEIEGFKLFAPNPALPSLATMPDSVEAFPMSIAMLPVPEEDLVVDLIFKPGNHTHLTLKNEMVDSFDSSLCFILEDRELNQFVPFNINDEYAFDVTSATTEKRFALRVSAPIQVTVLPETCPEAEDGRIVAEGYGVAPWTYVWENEMGEVIRTQADMTTADSMDDLLPGFYTVTVSNSNELCGSQTEVVQVTAAAPMEITYEADPVTCYDATDGMIAISPTSGYTWDVNLLNQNNELVGSMVAINADTSFTNLPSAAYSLQATSSCGYTFVFDEVSLNNSEAVVADFYPSSSIILLSNGGTAYFNNESINATAFTWDFGDGTTDELSVSPQHNYQTTGDFVVRLTAINDSCSHVFESVVHVSGNADNLTNEDLALVTDQETVSKINTSMSGTQMTFTPKMAIDQKVNVVVYNMAGQVVIQDQYSALQANPYQLELSSLSKGFYTMTIATHDEILMSYDFIIHE